MLELEVWTEKSAKEASASAFWVFLVLKLLALFIAGAVLLKLFGSKFNEVVNYSHKNPWKMLGIGFLATILVPIVSLILLATVIGAYLGILLALACLLLSIMAGILTVFYTGSLVMKYVFRKSENRLSWKTLLVGVIAGGILAIIPVIGWIVMLVLFLISFGATLRLLRGQVEV